MTKPLPTTLDLRAIHEGLIEAGFTRLRTEDVYAADPNWVYARTDEKGNANFSALVSLPNPDSDLSADRDFPLNLAQVAAGAARALDALIKATGQAHLDCGPRNDRERMYAEALNATNDFA